VIYWRHLNIFIFWRIILRLQKLAHIAAITSLYNASRKPVAASTLKLMQTSGICDASKQFANVIAQARSIMPPETVDVLAFHHPCFDGSAAAAAAHMARGETIDYLPLAHNDPLNLTRFATRNVLFVDICLTPEKMQQIRQVASSVMVLDHHDSAKVDSQNNPGSFLWNSNSGALLAWRYFHGFTVDVPYILDLIEQRDIFKFSNRADSDALHYALTEQQEKPDFRALLPYFNQTNLEQLLQRGRQLVEANKAWCVKTAKEAVNATMRVGEKSYSILALELPSVKLISEIGEYLYTNNTVDFVMLWFKQPSGKYQVSLRNNRADINLSELAKNFNGGGHPRASGFISDKSPWELLDSVSNNQTIAPLRPKL
jgi:nanoRNase/pAp phosphatase (c-di-AMP/oligoRNAs hydrolase)